METGRGGKTGTAKKTTKAQRPIAKGRPTASVGETRFTYESFGMQEEADGRMTMILAGVERIPAESTNS